MTKYCAKPLTAALSIFYSYCRSRETRAAELSNGFCSERAETGWRAALGTAAGLLLLLAACATPVQVERVDPRAVQRELTSNAISTGDISEPTQIVLHRQDLSELFEIDPEAAIASLHHTVTVGKPDPDAMFALSELSFRHAEDTGKPD